MSGELVLARDPNAPGQRAYLLTDWLELIHGGRRGCVDAMVRMCEDPHRHGEESRFVKPLGGALLELKTRTPLGGARVYFFRGGRSQFVLCRAECKRETAASADLLNHTASLFAAYRAGRRIF